MTIKQLKKKLEQISHVGAINRARRRVIIEMINRMAGEGA